MLCKEIVMKTTRYAMSSSLFLAAALAWTGNAWATDAMGIKGTFSVKYVKQEALPVTDATGPVLILGEAQGVNESTGRQSYMDGAQVSNKEINELVQGNGTHRGYVTMTSRDGDQEITQWNGDVTTVMKDGQPMTSFKGTWQKISGTGKLQGIQGRGTYAGHFTSQTEYVVDYIGQVTVPLASK
jgi:hypothetical protein